MGRFGRLLCKRTNMKILVIPDSFKGTLSSREAGSIIRETILADHPDYDILAVEVADGGEGTVDAVLRGRKGTRVETIVAGPYMETMKAEYAWFKEDNSAVIEMASCAGLPLVKGRMNPRLTTTYGVGQQVKDAISRGINNIFIGLGGSCTTDGGCGYAAALGTRFFNEKGEEFIPTGETLKDICRIEPAQCNASITAVCDVNNPLYGPLGASYVFARQKGADDDDIIYLDEGLRHLADVVKENLNIDLAEIPGAGAAGGMGYGLMVFTNARVRKGIDMILDIINYEKLIKDCDIIITGEGRLDFQSFHGKVIDGIIKRSSGKRVILVVGIRDEEIRKGHEVYSTMDNGRVFPHDHKEAVENLKAAVKEIVF